jgi:hypothetical protein
MPGRSFKPRRAHFRTFEEDSGGENAFPAQSACATASFSIKLSGVAIPVRIDLLNAAQRLHAHLARRHLAHGLLSGPDSGVRFNLRLWRFLKSGLYFIPWHDDYVFMQTQGYWALANWVLHETTGEPRYRELAIQASQAVLALQKPDGSWAYPLPERRHLIATVEGNWGALAMLATYAREPRQEFLNGAVRWYDFLVSHIGFQEHERGKAVNYYDRPRGMVPNNSVEAAWFFLRLWKATREDRYLEHVEGLLEFLASVQLPSGELPYIVANRYEDGRDHYLCFQYNAFQFLKLVWANALQSGALARDLLPHLAQFLAKGVTASGSSAADCARGRPEVDYYTGVLAAALFEAARHGWSDCAELNERCYARLLERQRADGSYAFSKGDYGFLDDGRSYPRPQAMTLFHLLYPMGTDGFGESRVQSQR